MTASASRCLLASLLFLCASACGEEETQPPPQAVTAEFSEVAGANVSTAAFVADSFESTRSDDQSEVYASEESTGRALHILKAGEFVAGTNYGLGSSEGKLEAALWMPGENKRWIAESGTLTVEKLEAVALTFSFKDASMVAEDRTEAEGSFSANGSGTVYLH